MTDNIEFEGKTVEKALEAASKELAQPMEDIKYDVVSYGSSGIFGLVGVKKAKIRVKTTQLPNDRTIQKEARQQARDLVKDAFQLEDDPKAEPEAESEADTEPDQEGESLPPEVVANAAEVGLSALQKIVDFITEGATVSADTDASRIIFNVAGGNSSVLIGKRGQTLEALQYLVEKIVNKKSDQRIRILVDVEGYLEQRKTNLKSLASRMAEKAIKINKPVTIGQMNAYDRRTVHLHLKDNQEVRTQSIGEGYYRKLVIFPKKRKRNREMN
jgi:spoIIIJ-associated protein